MLSPFSFTISVFFRIVLIVYRISVVACILHIFYAGTQIACFQDQLQAELCNQNASNISGTDRLHFTANIKYTNSQKLIPCNPHNIYVSPTAQPVKWTDTKLLSRFESVQKYQVFSSSACSERIFPSKCLSKEYVKENYGNNSVTSN